MQQIHRHPVRSRHAGALGQHVGRIILPRGPARARTVSRVALGADGFNHAEQELQQQQQRVPPTQKAVEPPRPPEMLGLGHMLPMMQQLSSGMQFESLMLQWRQQYGPCFEWQMPGNPPVVVVTDPEAIKEVYEVKQYPKSPRYADLLPIVGAQSMLLTEGHVWKSQREAFNPGFSSSFLKSALPGFVSCTNNLVQLLGERADAQQVVKMHHVAILTTLEVICKVGFGEDVNLLQSNKSAGLWTAFEAVGRHCAYYIDNVPINWMKHLPWNKEKTSRLQAEYDQQLLPILLKRLNEMGINVSEQEQQQLLSGAGSRPGSPAGSKCPIPGVHSASSSSSSSGSSSEAQCPMASAAATEAAMDTSKDILTLAVKLSRQPAEGGGSGVDLDVLMSQMKTFFAAGHDTTASLIGWTMWFLMNHPEVEARLVDEVLRVMRRDTEPNYQQLSEMRYLNAVLKESLRVRPPVGVLARFAPKGATLQGNDGVLYNISEKVLLVSPYLQHMDADVWGPDAAEFKPERWLVTDGPAQQVSQYSYMPFSRGPRDCIGSRFALLEAKTIMSMMYRRFEFEYAGDKPEEVLMSVTAHPKYGVPLHVRQRPELGQQAPAAAAVAAAAVPC